MAIHLQLECSLDADEKVQLIGSKADQKWY